MYKFYIVPDATKLNSHAEIYEQMQLLWDPLTESDAYAITENPKWKEELNKSSSLEFTVLPANIHYNDFHKKRTVIVVYDDEDWLFEGIVTDAPLDFYKRRKVTCADPLSFLAGSVQAPDEKNEINVSTSGSSNRYFPVPDAWYTGANPKSLDWYEQTINAIYTQVEETAVYVAGTTYYMYSGEAYYVWNGNANSWASRPTLYTANGSEPVYKKSTDTSANADKKYFYLVTANSLNYSGSTTLSAAATKESIIAHISRLLNVHNSQVDYFKKIHPGKMYNDSDTDQKEFKAANFRTTWDAFKTDVIDEYGKYFRIELGEDHELYLDYLELHQLPTVPDSIAPTIEFANNMMQMSESDNDDDDIFTVLVPIGKNNLTVKDVTGHDSPQHNDDTHEVDPYIASWGGNKRYVVVSRKAIKRYGYIIKTQQFSDVDDASTLWDRAKKYIQNNYDYHTEYEVKAIDLRFINGSGHRIRVGDKVRLKSTWHGIDTVDLYIISAEHDLVNPENDSYRIGIPTSDREANNRTLTGQSNSARNKNASNSASNSSATSRLHSILEDYIHVTEWGLEMSSNLKNEVESNDGKYMTRFLQDEEHINLAAQKLFGVDGDGVGDTDAGYAAVRKADYKKSSGAYKNPNEEHWFEKVGSKYQLSSDVTCDPSVVGDKQYYVQRLWTRYSDIDVGSGGIKARVDGNYATSTYCSSWIEMNEESILALTGHLWVDEEGHVHVTSGSGMRTDHQEENTTETFIQVARTMYAENPNPQSKHWYERKLDSSNAWLGQGKSDAATNSDYYTLTRDTTVDRSKYYYYKSNIRETFVAEYGVYDEDNLTAGVISRMVNNPTYHKVSDYVVENLANNAGSPKAQGWYEYNDSTGSYGLTLDTAVPRDSRYGRPINKYYTVTNNMETYTDIWGQHIVIGKTDGYAGIDAATQAKVDKYISDHNLDGTITEIASDVVVVNALIAKYIETDEIVVNTMLAAEAGFFSKLHVGMNAEVTADEDGDLVAISAYFDWLSGGNTTVQSLRFAPIGIGVGLGYNGGYDELGRMGNPADIVFGFGTPTYSGDDVSIPFTTLYDYCQNKTDDDHVITFTKPASLGSVTWSSGDKTLTAKTVGGRDFLVGEIRNYVPSGQSEAMAMQNAGYLATETTGYSQVYGIYYTRKDASNNNVSAKTMLFKTPKNRYPDAVSTIKTYSNWAKGDDEEIVLGYSGSANVFAQYQTEAQFDAGSETMTNKAGVTIKSPSKGEYRTYAKVGETEYTSGTIPLGFSGEITVYGQRKMDGDTSYESATGIKVTAPAKPSYSISSPASATLPSGASATSLSYGTTYEVHLLEGSTNAGGSVYFTAPSDNSTSLSTSDITLGDIDTSQGEPTADAKLTDLLGAIKECLDTSNSNRWVKFKVKAGSLASKTYKIDCG